MSCCFGPTLLGCQQHESGLTFVTQYNLRTVSRFSTGRFSSLLSSHLLLQVTNYLPFSPTPKGYQAQREILPVLNNPIFLPIYIFPLKAITYNQNTMVQVFTAALWFIVDTCRGISSHMNKFICRKPFSLTRSFVYFKLNVAQPLESQRKES